MWVVYLPVTVTIKNQLLLALHYRRIWDPLLEIRLIPTEYLSTITISSVIQSVYTNGILRSVYIDVIIDGILRFKEKAVRWRGTFCVRFSWWNHRGIQTRIFVHWRDQFTVRMADGLTEGFKPGSTYIDVTNSSTELPT